MKGGNWKRLLRDVDEGVGRPIACLRGHILWVINDVAGGLTASYENFVRPVLISQLRGIALSGFLFFCEIACRWQRRENTYKLDGYLLVVQQVCSFEYHAE